MKLKNKVAFITGGSRGIGAAIAKRLAAEGALVTLTYVNGKEKADAVVTEIEKAGGKARAIQVDNADPKAVAAAVEKVGADHSRLDILVNNAGVYAGGPIDDPKRNAAEVEREFAINVGGAAAAVHAATKLMGKGGRIISIGSINGSHSVVRGMGDYCATKAALAGYTRGWARDLGPKEITVNNIQPGPIDTDMNPDNDSDFAKILKSGTALRRYGTSEEVAAVVAFLASEDASYVTGTSIDVDGGHSA